jgi:hypothetical protein
MVWPLSVPSGENRMSEAVKIAMLIDSHAHLDYGGV